MNRSHAKLIGLFVFGAALILVAALAMFTTGDLFQKKIHFIGYFDQSVNGLSIGAPVKFRGVEIGEVTMVEGVYDDKRQSVTPRVTMVVLPERLTNAQVDRHTQKDIQKLIENGMRASLKSQSMLTGKLYVSLDFYKNKPARYMADKKDKYQEIPTMETGLSRFVDSIGELPVDQTLAQLNSTLASVESLLKNKNLNQSLAELPSTIAAIRATSQNLDRFTANELPNSTLAMRDFFVNSDKNVTAVSTRLNQDVISRLAKTLDEVDNSLKLAQARLDRNDPVSREMVATLREVSETATTLRRLAESIEDHPEELLKGRKEK